MWKQGKKSFKKDPPNAVLSGSGIKTQIVILNGIHVKKDSVDFSITEGGNVKHKVLKLTTSEAQGATLTIDSTTIELTKIDYSKVLKAINNLKNNGQN